jgi:hypothetical protein
MSAMREELHQLVDQLREDELRPTLELIRDRVTEPGGLRHLRLHATRNMTTSEIANNSVNSLLTFDFRT